MLAGGRSISAGSVLRGGLTFFESACNFIYDFQGGDVAAADGFVLLPEADDACRRLI